MMSMKTTDKKVLVLIIAIAVISAAVYFIIFQKPYYKDVKIHTDHYKGSDNASVTVLEYSDFQCPSCGRIQPVIEQVLQTYGSRIKFVYRHFPLTSIHPYAWKAAEASECADEQEKFWEYHDKLFENQDALTISDLKLYASELGLDGASFNACLDSDAMSKYVQRDSQRAMNAGARGTPEFFINGGLMSGALTFESFKAGIEKAVA